VPGKPIFQRRSGTFVGVLLDITVAVVDFLALSYSLPLFVCWTMSLSFLRFGVAVELVLEEL
jgi:hypothetical protein